MKYCKICGKEFNAIGRSLCCGEECMLINKRKNRMASWFRVGKKHDDKYLRHIRQKMRRIRSKHEKSDN